MDKSVIKDIRFNEYGRVDTDYYIAMAKHERSKAIAELADHRMPIKNLYATGAAWGPVAGAHTGQGSRCYKAMAEDLGLAKPWENKERPF